jgi:signal transduction histidine kinase/tetratricopeptide (TPR) repeat protein
MFIPKTRVIFWPVIVLLLILSFTACRQSTRRNIDHSAYFDAVFRHADSLQANGFTKGRTAAYIDSAYNHFHDAGTGDLYRKYDFMRKFYYDKDYSKSMSYIDSMLNVLKDHTHEKTYKKLYQSTILLKGDILVAQKRLTEAFKYYYEAQEIGKKTKDTAFLSEYFTQLGMISYKQEKFKEAASYFRRAVDMYLMVRNDTDFTAFRNIQMNLDNVALSYDGMGLYDSAKIYYNQALNFIAAHEASFDTSAGNHRFITSAKGVVYGNLAYLLYKQHDTAHVEELLLKSININKQPGYDNDDAMYMQLKLAGLYMDANRLADCQGVLNEVKATLDAGMQAEKDLRLRWLLQQEQLFDKLHKRDSAYLYLKEYVTLEDSITNRNLLSRETDIGSAFANVARQHELAALKTDDRFKSIVLMMISLLVVFLMIIVFLIWRASERSKENLQLLSLQNHRLTSTLRLLEAREQENASLLKVIMHDLKNPVGNISAIAGLLMDEDYDSEQRKSMYQMINNASGQAFAIINQLLENKNKEGLNPLQTIPTDVPALLMECVDLLQFKALNKRQRFKVGRIPPGTAQLDREKIWQLFTNIIDNAIKFSPEKSVINISATRTNDTFTIAVKDNGIGIPPELKEKIFQMNTDAGRPGTAGEPSYGLGLSISRKIAEMHNGKLWFESEPGKGATFYVSLPCMPVSKRHPNEPEMIS